MKIGELARATRAPVETIRYYEHAGLLQAPPRTEGNYRDYGEAHVRQLSFIRHCRSLDLSLDEIRVLLRVWQAPGVDCADVNALLDTHIAQVAERMAELQRLQAQLQALRTRCEAPGEAAHCGILTGLSCQDPAACAGQ